VKLKVSQIKAGARSVLDQVTTIKEIRIASLECHGEPVPHSGMLTVNTDVGVGVSQNEDKSSIEVRVEYAVVSTTPEEPVVEAWRVILTVVGVWDQDAEKQFSHPDLWSFAVLVGVMTLHPYAREIVQSAVSRMGYPAYLMEIFRSPAELLGDDAEVEAPAEG